MQKSGTILRNQKGFTLIEIISVLVILGILAAVAIPRYMSLMTDAKQKSAETAIAEGAAQVNNAAARYILRYGEVPTSLSDLMTQATLSPPLANSTAGDWLITFTTGSAIAGGPSVNVKVDGNATAVQGFTANKDIALPR